jgi:hypothetical protein
MKTTKIFSVIGIYILFIAVFIFSTDGVMSLPLKNIHRLKEIKPNQYENVSSELNYKVDTFTENQDILFTVEFSGWAFIHPVQDGSKKEIKLVFISEKKYYEVGTSLQERFDLRAILEENKIQGFKHGFITKFSPLQMKNGVYELYLYCYEGDGASAIVDTQRTFEKTNRMFTELKDDPAP